MRQTIKEIVESGGLGYKIARAVVLGFFLGVALLLVILAFWHGFYLVVEAAMYIILGLMVCGTITDFEQQKNEGGAEGADEEEENQEN